MTFREVSVPLPVWTLCCSASNSGRIVRDAVASAGRTLVELFGLAHELNVDAEGIDVGPSPVDVFHTEHGGPALSVSQTVATGVQPKSVNVSPDGTRVVVCNFGFADHDNVFVYDAMTLERLHVWGWMTPGAWEPR